MRSKAHALYLSLLFARHPDWRNGVTLETLLSHDPAWPALLSRLEGSGTVWREPSERARLATLQAIGVSTRSTLGAIIYETGGISFRDGLIRHLGAAPTTSQRNIQTFARSADLSGALVIGDDPYGGLYLLNGGALPGVSGNVVHVPSDTMIADDLGIGHTDFIEWCLTGEVNELYAPLEAVKRSHPPSNFDFTESLSIYPFLWTVEGRDPAQASTRVVPAWEVGSLTLANMSTSDR